MRANKIFLLSIFAVFLSGCFSEKKITETEVQQIMSKIETATKNKDADGICANLSEKAQLKLRISAGGQTQNMTLNREQYRDVLKKAFVAGSDYTYSRSKESIKISGDGNTATVSDETNESIKINGQLYSTVGTEAATLKRENGNLVILYLNADGYQR